MQELTVRGIRALQAGTPEGNSEQIRSALSRGLPELDSASDAHEGHFVIVGSGPSLPSVFDQIKEEKGTICAINGAHDFLCEKGLEPDLFVTCDPRDTILGNIKRKNQHTVYLLASRVHPSVFDHLSDCKVVVWHSFASRTDAQPPEAENPTWDDFDPEVECEAFRGRFCVGGGSTSGLRAINLAYIKGYRKLSMYGMDSCLAPDKFTKRFSGENIGNGQLVDVIVGGRRFWCNGAMAKQAVEFQQVISSFPDLKVTVHGDGLLAEIMKHRARR